VKRSFSRRPEKKYLWAFDTTQGGFSANDVLEIILLDAQDYVTGALVQSTHTLNLQRIIGDVVVLARTAQDLDNIADQFVAGPVAWGLFIQDGDDASVLDPASAIVADEVSLGLGLTECIGIGVAVSIVSGVTAAFEGVYPFSTKIHFDIHTNRRMNNDQQLKLNLTRPTGTPFQLAPDESFQALSLIRTLVKLP